jgi:hypothetical protein
MIIIISYNTAPNCTNDWISWPEVLQTVLVYAVSIRLKVSWRWGHYARTFEISVLVYNYHTPLPRKKIDSSSLLQSYEAYSCPPYPSKVSKVLHTFESWLISLSSSLFIIAQKVKLFGMYHSYWESSCNRRVGRTFFCFTWESIKMLT